MARCARRPRRALVAAGFLEHVFWLLKQRLGEVRGAEGGMKESMGKKYWQQHRYWDFSKGAST